LGVGRRAKYLLVHLDDGCVLVMHLGMTGRFSVKLADRGRRAGSPPASVVVPSPLVGEGQGGGDSRTFDVGLPPTPLPSPQGGGEECAAIGHANNSARTIHH
jgi:hypothetical protein